MAHLNFSSRIADAQTNLEKDGFKSSLWEPEWDVSDKEAFAPPYEPQLLAALQAFAWMFVSSVKSVWVHLAAEMQAGKTGVIAALSRLVLSNAKRLNFTPERIFVVTGMSDEAWHKQTAPRLPDILRENVYHGGTLSQIVIKLERLASSDCLRNVLIFIDESHLASTSANQPARYIYDTIARLSPCDKWSDNNIRFVTISATDPAKVIAMKSSVIASQVVRLHTTDEYQSVEKLQNTNRIRFLQQIPDNGVLHTESGFNALASAVYELEKQHGPLNHILRPNHGKGALVADRIRDKFPHAIIREWDVASNIANIRRAKEDGASGIGSVSDINRAILNDQPLATTFILLKGMFRAAKTLNDKYVGVLYDRVGGADATNLQSLLGRACGYGKSQRTIIFTSNDTVNNYIRLWRELCASKSFPSEGNDELFSKLKGRMPGVTTVSTIDATTKLVTTSGHATPFGVGIGTATDEEKTLNNKQKFNDDDYTDEWSQEFSSINELKASKLTSGKMPKLNNHGYYPNALNPKNGPMDRAQLMKAKTMKKTTGMMFGRILEIGQSTHRTYSFYEDTNDHSTAKFIVRTLTRIR